MNQILNIDCLEGLKTLADNSIDLIVTSPPYNIGKTGGDFQFKGYDTYSDKLEEEAYDTFIINILNECYRVLKPEGSLLLNHKVRTVNFEAIHPIKYIEKTPFFLKQEIVWDRGKTQQTNMDRFFPINEMLYWCIKDKKSTIFNRESARHTTVWRINQVNKKKEGCEGHPAPFPLEIAKRAIKTFTVPGSLVLDPFLGSGTTAVAAKLTGREYIGFELSPSYIDIAKERLEQAVEESETELSGISTEALQEELIKRTGKYEFL